MVGGPEQDLTIRSSWDMACTAVRSHTFVLCLAVEEVSEGASFLIPSPNTYALIVQGCCRLMIPKKCLSL